MRHQATVSIMIRDYFRQPASLASPSTLEFDEHPIITQTFRPGVGWKTTGYRKRVSESWLRKLAREDGVTHVTLTAYGRHPDFSIAELLAGYRRDRTSSWA